MTLFPVLYFPPISYFQKWMEAENILLEKHENFQKQTFRNRCYIQGANGKQMLIIPVEHDGKRFYKDTKISFAANWQKEHIKSLESAYRRSPYFEFYEDEIIPLIEKKENYLFDFNIQILERILSILQLDFKANFTNAYAKEVEKDFRNYFNAKNPKTFELPEYTQVFAEKHDFIPDLSILDLLCNKGPQTVTYLNAK